MLRTTRPPVSLLLVSFLILSACGGGGGGAVEPPPPPPPPPTFTIGGTVTGLVGGGLILQNNGGDDLSIASDGSFVFSTRITSGGAYAVAVSTQPTSPEQICTVANGSGTASSTVNNVSVTCVTVQYSVGGAVAGLAGAGLVLQNNGGDDLPISADGVFTFASLVDSGAAYDVTVLTQPIGPEQVCTVGNGSGTATANVADITITCVTVQYSVGGTVSGLTGAGLVLQNNGGDDLAIAADGVFTFASLIDSGAAYDVTVLTQPTGPEQVCAVGNGSGSATANVADITITCVTVQYSVGGTVSGLTGTGLVLQNNGGDDLAISADGAFQFATPIDSGSTYVVTVLTQPTGPVQSCTVSDGSGTISGNVTDVSVTCLQQSFTVGGTVTGLAGGTGLELQLNGGDDLLIAADGSFTFPTDLTDGSLYEVTVLTEPTATPARDCAVNDGIGQLAGAPVSNINVLCNPIIDLYVADDEVTSIALSDDGSTIYLGGDFSMIGPRIGAFTPFDTTTGQATGMFDEVVGIVNAAAPDGSGGWYVGGSFRTVAGQPFENLVHIRSDGTVDPNWAPNPNDSVNSIVVSGSTVYVAGPFGIIGGQPRGRLAALDATTGLATAWNPRPNNLVFSLALSGNGTLYVGGQFGFIDGTQRNRLAELDLATGTPTAWDPNVIGSVRSIAIAGSTMYIGGDIGLVGGQARNRLAAVDTVTAAPTSWSPGADGAVLGIEVDGSTVYVAGEFTVTGGQPRRGLAAIDATAGTATAWNPGSSDDVSGITLSGGLIYATGAFTSIGGETRNYVAAVDPSTGLATAWDPNLNGPGFSIAVSGGAAFVGGDFTSAAGVTRTRLAAIDTASGMVTAWNPGADASVAVLEVSGNTVYVGGYFANVGGLPRSGIASIDATTGLVNPWAPDVDNLVLAISVEGNTVYAGGLFTIAGGQLRNNIASFDATTGLVTNWNPNADNVVLAIATSGNTVYVGGSFLNIGGQTRFFVAALDSATGLASAWDADANNIVRAIKPIGNTVYVAGDFRPISGQDSIGGEPRFDVAGLDMTTALATDFDVVIQGVTYTFDISGNTLYVGGSISEVGPEFRDNIAAVNILTSTPTGFDPVIIDRVSKLIVTDSVVYVSGQVSNVDGKGSSYIGSIPR